MFLYLNTEQLSLVQLKRSCLCTVVFIAILDQRISSHAPVLLICITSIHAIRRLSLCVQDRMALYRAFLRLLYLSLHSESQSLQGSVGMATKS